MTDEKFPCAQPAPELPAGWRLAKVSDGDIRVYGPDKETWLIRKDSGEGFYDFIHRFFDALASQSPAVAHAPRQSLPPQSPVPLTDADLKTFRLGWLECEAAHGIGVSHPPVQGTEP